jgi:hypothetical protein
MLVMFRKTKPAIRTLRGWAISVLHEAGAIRECEEHWTGPTRTHVSARSTSQAKIRRPASLRSRPLRRSVMCWIRSVTPARSARRTRPISIAADAQGLLLSLRGGDIIYFVQKQ